VPVYWPGGVRRRGDVSLVCCVRVEREKACLDTAALVRVVRGSLPSGWNREGLSTVARRAGGPARSSCEASVMGAEPRGRVIRGCVRPVNWAVGLGGTAWAS
jgi:hypothetical protein